MFKEPRKIFSRDQWVWKYGIPLWFSCAV